MADISGLSTDMLKASPDIPDLSFDAAGLADEVSKLSNDVSRLSADISKLPNDISRLSNDISKRPDDVSKLSVDISKLSVDISKLSTEKRNKRTMQLDEMTPYEIISIMNEEDYKVVEAVRQALPQIEKAIRWTTASLREGGRILYVGAGTSGRIGILDAVECPPTFGVSYNVVVGVIAGGQEAFVKAREGAEDDPKLGKQDLQDHRLTDKDVVIGLAASGRTPYVIGALRYARELGCRTVSISNNENAPVSAEAELAIELLTGPEVLTGSTRLKAGTAEKMVLNMISTASMVGIGKVYENLMVDVRQSNEKLVIRSENIVMEAVGCSREEARKNLEEAGGRTKLAITKMLLGCDVDTADESLRKAGGKVKAAISERTGLRTTG